MRRMRKPLVSLMGWIRKSWIHELCFVVFWSYMIFCLYQLNTPAIDVSLEALYAVGESDKGERLIDSTKPTVIRSGENLKAVYHTVRHFEATDHVERTLVTADEKVYIIEVLDVTLFPGHIGNFVIYKIPKHFAPGCGYTVYSANIITFNYNILSFFKSSYLESPRLQFCIAEK